MNNRMKRIGRWFKYKYTLLLRAKGGPSIVARGFAVGLAVEMITLPTAGLAFFLIFPLVYLFRASLAGALVGFVFGKVIYVPLAISIIPKVGGLLITKTLLHTIQTLPGWLGKILAINLRLILGGLAVGTGLGLILFLPIRLMLQYYANRRKEKRRLRKQSAPLNEEKI